MDITNPWALRSVVPVGQDSFVLMLLILIISRFKLGNILKRLFTHFNLGYSSYEKPPSPLCHQTEWELILFPLQQVGFPFDCLSLLLAWCYYWRGFLAFIIHFYAAIFSWNCYPRHAHRVALFMHDWFVDCWSCPPPLVLCRLGGSTRLLIHRW